MSDMALGSLVAIVASCRTFSLHFFRIFLCTLRQNLCTFVGNRGFTSRTRKKGCYDKKAPRKIAKMAGIVKFSKQRSWIVLYLPNTTAIVRSLRSTAIPLALCPLRNIHRKWGNARTNSHGPVFFLNVRGTVLTARTAAILSYDDVSTGSFLRCSSATTTSCLSPGTSSVSGTEHVQYWDATPDIIQGLIMFMCACF